MCGCLAAGDHGAPHGEKQAAGDANLREANRFGRDGGYLTILARGHVSPPGDNFFRQVERVYDEVGMGDGQGGPTPPEAILAPDVEAIGGTGSPSQRSRVDRP